MKKNYPPLLLTVFAVLTAMIACVLPGQATQQAPVVNVNIETAIAGTSQAAAQQTEQAGVISVTATTVSQEPTSAPESISSFGTSLVPLEDGSTQFRDYRAGVQIIFPAGWLAVRPGEHEYYEAWEKQATQSQWLLDEIASIQNLDLDIFRVNVYDTRPEHIFNDTLPKINIVFLQNDTRTLKQADANEKAMIKNSVQAGHKYLSSDFQSMAGLDVLIFQSQWNGVSFPTTHYIGTFFRVPTGLVVIDFYIASDQLEYMRPEWEQVVQSIKLFTP